MTNSLPRPFVICGPSGVGKSTLMTRLFEEYPSKFGFSVSHTTRSPRHGEIDGQHYHFIDRESMQKAIDSGEFIETAEFNQNLYGTSKTAVESVCKKNIICVLDIEIEGVKQMKKSNLNAFYVFLMPPSIDHLRNRLMARNTETDASLERRLERAVHEIDFAKQSNVFDKIIVNDSLTEAYEQLKQFLSKSYPGIF